MTVLWPKNTKIEKKKAWVLNGLLQGKGGGGGEGQAKKENKKSQTLGSDS